MSLNRFKNGFQEPETSGTQIIKQHAIFLKKKYETLLARSACLSNRITVDIQSIPRQENREADAISKMINYDE